MEPSPLVQLAQTVAWLGALGVGTAACTIVALRLVRADEVPGWVQARIRFWTAHNPAFLLVSAAVTVAGLAVLAVAGR
jgi:hypothetical protein